jgi:hypothetical protein
MLMDKLSEITTLEIYILSYIKLAAEKIEFMQFLDKAVYYWCQFPHLFQD